MALTDISMTGTESSKCLVIKVFQFYNLAILTTAVTVALSHIQKGRAGKKCITAVAGQSRQSRQLVRPQLSLQLILSVWGRSGGLSH